MKSNEVKRKFSVIKFLYTKYQHTNVRSIYTLKYLRDPQLERKIRRSKTALNLITTCVP